MEASKTSNDEFRRRVLIVEDQPLIRHSLVTTLQGRGFDVAEAADAPSGIKTFRDFDPDGLLIDIDLGSGPSGLDLLDGLRALAKDSCSALDPPQ